MSIGVMVGKKLVERCPFCYRYYPVHWLPLFDYWVIEPHRCKNRFWRKVVLDKNGDIVYPRKYEAGGKSNTSPKGSNR